MALKIIYCPVYVRYSGFWPGVVRRMLSFLPVHAPESSAKGTLARKAGIAARLEPAGGCGDPAGIMGGVEFWQSPRPKPKNRRRSYMRLDF
jgi:hypothetical protein